MAGNLQSAVAARQAPFTNFGRADQPRITQGVLAGGPAHRQVVARAHLSLPGQAARVLRRIDCNLVSQARDLAGHKADSDTTAQQYTSLAGTTSRRSNAVAAACAGPIQASLVKAVSGRALQGQS